MLGQGTDLWNGQTDPGIRVEPARKNIISAPWPQRAAWLSQRGPELRTGGSAGGSQVLGHSSYSLFLLEPFICVQCQGWGLTHLPGGWETAPQVSKGRSRVQPPAYPPPPHTIKQAQLSSLCDGWRHAAQEPYLPSLLPTALCQAVTHKAGAPASLGFHLQSLR